LPFLGDHRCCIGTKDRFGISLTQPEESGPTWGVFSSLFSEYPSACVSRTRMGSFAQIWHRRASTKGKESGQKKSTHDEFHRLGPWVRTGGTRCVLVRSEPGLLSRYGTTCALYMEKNSVNKSQHITKYPSLDPAEEAFGTRRGLTFVDRILFHIWRSYGAVSGQKTPFG
jgi:hypothetical protein